MSQGIEAFIADKFSFNRREAERALDDVLLQEKNAAESYSPFHLLDAADPMLLEALLEVGKEKVDTLR